VRPKRFLSLWNVRRKPCTNLGQDLRYLQMYRNELSLVPHHLGVPLGVSITISEPIVRLAQTMHLSCIDTNTISKQTEMGFLMTHVTLEFHWVRPE